MLHGCQMFQKIEPRSVCAKRCLPKRKMLWLRRRGRKGRIFSPTKNWELESDDDITQCLEAGGSTPPLATTAHCSFELKLLLHSHRLRLKPSPEATLPTFSEHSPYRRKLFCIVCFYNCLFVSSIAREFKILQMCLLGSSDPLSWLWLKPEPLDELIFTQPDRERKWLL